MAAGIHSGMIAISGLNKKLGRTGAVFADRYHDHSLRTPSEVRNALLYVLNNARRHAAQHKRRLPRTWLDPCSSARVFHGLGDDGAPLPLARTWLLREGWRKAGTIPVGRIPPPRSRPEQSQPKTARRRYSPAPR